LKISSHGESSQIGIAGRGASRPHLLIPLDTVEILVSP
jgi:hypothetical protein